MTIIQNKVPKLRFPEFNGEWDNITLGEIGKVSMCKRIMKDQTTEKGEIPFYKIGTFGKKPDAFIERKLYKEFKNKFSYPKKGDILIAASGATYGKIVIFDGDEAYFQDSNIVWIANDETLVNNQFLYLCYQRIRWTIEESTIPRLYNSVIRGAKLRIPILPEQQKIASFLSSIDTKIEQLTKKKSLLELYKKGVMQQIFSQDLRFKDENGNDYNEWVEVGFDEVYQSIPTKKHQINSSEILSNGKFKVVDQGKKLFAGFSNDESKVLLTIPVIIYGDHTTVVKYIDFPFIIGADGTKILFSKNNNNNINYLYYYLQFNNIESEGYKRHFSILRKIKVQVPCLNEQTQIANFLNAIDIKIELVNTQLENTQQFKKGLLQQLFV